MCHIIIIYTGIQYAGRKPSVNSQLFFFLLLFFLLLDSIPDISEGVSLSLEIKRSEPFLFYGGIVEHFTNDLPPYGLCECLFRHRDLFFISILARAVKSINRNIQTLNTKSLQCLAICSHEISKITII